MFTDEVKHLCDNMKVSSITNSPKCRELIRHETSFLDSSYRIPERVYYIKNDIYEPLLCPICLSNPSKYDFINNRVKCCSLKCGSKKRVITLSNIDSKTGLNGFESYCKKSVETRNKIDPETGKRYYELSANKIAKIRSQIDPITGKSCYDRTGEKISKIVTTLDYNGESIASIRGKKLSEYLELIDAETGKSNGELYSQRLYDYNHKINPLTNKPNYFDTAKKSAKTMKDIDKETGLCIYDIISEKYSKFANTISDNGKTNATNQAIKASITQKETILPTGKTIIEQIGISNKITHKTSTYEIIIEKFSELIEYTLLMGLSEYIDNSNRQIKFRHTCGNIIISNDYKHVNCRKCYPKFRGYSKVSIEWLESIMETEGIDIQHATNIGEYRIAGTQFRADGYCEETNTVYEFYGDYFHGNPIKYNPDMYNKSVKTTMGKLYSNTINRENTIKDLGYNLVSIWESDYKKNHQL